MHPYTRGLVQLFGAHANAEQAVPMKAYMKDVSDYLGIAQPDRKALMRGYVKEHGYPELNELETVVRHLWQQPYREYQYLACGLMERFATRLQPEQVELIEYLITTRSWWDTVDTVSINVAGPFLKANPKLERRYPGQWMNSGHMWLQRMAILYQLKYGQQTDTERLFGYCLQLADSKEFFIRKAMGWALREYSKTDAHAVVQFVEAAPVSNLTKREALKWLERKRSNS